MNTFYKVIKTKKGESIKVDPSDWEYLSKFNWYISHGYAERFVRIDGKLKHIKLHRVVANTPDGKVTDHINGDRLDNRRCNLRVCTQRQNSQNRGKQINNRSGFKGVKPVFERRQLFKAQITVNGEKKILGYFKNAEDAAKVYDEAAKQYFCEFANLNFSVSPQA